MILEVKNSAIYSFLLLVAVPATLIVFNYTDVTVDSSMLLGVSLLWLLGFMCLLLVALLFKSALISVEPWLLIFSISVVFISVLIPNDVGVLDGVNDELMLSEASFYTSFIKFFIVFTSLSFLRKFNSKLFSDFVAVFQWIVIAATVLVVVFIVVEKIGEDPDKVSQLSSFSNEHNVIVISFDAVPGPVIESVILTDGQYSSSFDGFTLYRDVISSAPNTARSIFLTLMGYIPEFSRTTKAWAEDNFESMVPMLLHKEKGYSISTYGPKGMLGTIDCRDTIDPWACVDAGDVLDSPSTDLVGLFSYSYMRVFPPIVVERFRRYLESSVLSLMISDMSEADQIKDAIGDDGKHGMGASFFEYNSVVNDFEANSSSPRFTFQHYTFSHEPVTFNGECEYKKSEDMPQNAESIHSQTKCVVSLMDKAIDKLKEIGVYNQSMIFFTSDHGASARYSDDSLGNINFGATLDNSFTQLSRYHPFLLYKPISSTGALLVNDRPISLLSIAPTICGSAIGTGFCRSIAFEMDSLENEAVKKGRRFIAYRGLKLSSEYYTNLDLFDVLSLYGSSIDGLYSLFRNDNMNILLSSEDNALSPGSVIDFSDVVSLSRVYVEGMASVEPHGRWSDSRIVRINFVAQNFGGIQLRLGGFVTNNYPLQKATLFLNDNYLGDIEVKYGDSELLIEFDVDESFLSGDNVHELRVIIDNPRSPLSIGYSTDPRSLGFSFSEMVLK